MKSDYISMIDKMLSKVRKAENSEKKLKMIYDYYMLRISEIQLISAI